ncbi:DUF2179 domain-containing protein [Dethiothermospora halolimnae]|uniref:DUF2179 domain-containing protein n=1 Tax=Dethiothermospora halolimnae TaxID=3114390 RepID=UPI003CCBFD56
MSIFLGYLFIFISRVMDVTLGTLRMLMVVQGQKIYASIIGFFEVGIYILALGKVVNSLDNPGNLLAYALGFASGNYIGIYIEEKVAMGDSFVQVITKSDAYDVVNTLRDKGFGVTVTEGHGREGKRNILNMTVKRRNLKKLHNVIDQMDSDAFITVSNTRRIRGGYFSKIKKK